MVGLLVDQRVASAEIAPGYVDAWGQHREISSQTRDALARALGPPSKKALPRVEVGRCYLPEYLERGGRVWGFMVQLYGVRSERNWGIGDFTDLKRLVELSAALGASVVGVNPLHATLGSPYSPNSRHALNPLYIDVEAVPGFEKTLVPAMLKRRIRALREAELVDYPGVAALKLQVLENLYTKVKPRKTRPSRFAIFEALREKFGYGWQGWPREYRDPRSAEVRRFAERNANRVGFHDFLQALARAQLEAAQKRARELGMPVGLYVDLALGADRGGAEVWENQRAFALDVSCGAPPDEFNPVGQDWGLPPYSPRALRELDYKPFAELLAANMPEGGALRMDHVMALSRLWWVPGGAKADEGGYVAYDFEPMLAILAAESRKKRCMVVGEDLGTVPPELRTALAAAHVLSYRPLLFEKSFPREALACVSTHDLPTWRGYWASHDLALRRSVGLTRDAEREQAARNAELAKLGPLGLDDKPLVAHAFIARVPSMIALLQPEDVFELLEQANLPGTVDQHPNWRRKLPLDLERWKADARVQATAQAMAERSVSPGRPLRVPDATYRVQLHKGFRFADATRLVPYLAKLGISHLYTSPFLKARPGSTHGYDVIDPNALNPEIGSEKDLAELRKALKKHGMGLVVDLVPNHMGVLQTDNAWWLDVLEKGPASPHAKFFDIDWKRGKLLLPVLGKHYGEVLESGELKVDLAKKCLRYFDHRFPLNAESLRGMRRPPKDALALHKLLERQHYRLAYWRVASDEINYRRFFEITDLAGMRMEDRSVFEATHALIRRLAQAAGNDTARIDGLRIDHPDGLADPEHYFEQLGEICARPWVVAEKILAEHEALPEWPLHGTTGYEFANLLTGVFVDAAAESRFGRIYSRFTGDSRRFAEVARESRLLIMDTTLAAELHMLSNWLARIASGNRFTRDYTASGLRKALAAVAAHFPVYRTYVTPRGVSEADRRIIDWAVNAARRASHFADPSVFDFVRSVLTLAAAPDGGPRRDEMARFAMRFQQFTAPVVAKGVEDTAFYRYNRFIALNEVGGNPGRFGVSLKAFHAESEARARRWPYTMLATSTHDTKRSEDARARLAALSENAGLWRMALRRWSLVNRSHRGEAGGEPAPSPADETHFYQALIAVWPGDSPESLADRLQAYMLKAAREAKVRTSWINSDAEYEAALERFVRESLANPLFQRDLQETLPRLVHLGRLVGLSQALVKVASPGVPDYYQGTELWDFSLVDPDNRRPVDYGVRVNFLESTSASLDGLESGKAKLHIIRKGLEVRRKLPALFHGGRYQAIYADGGREENLLAFALSGGANTVVALAPRLFARLMQPDDAAPLGERAWGDAAIEIPAGRYENVLTGERHEGGRIALSRLLSSCPVALLVSD